MDEKVYVVTLRGSIEDSVRVWRDRGEAEADFDEALEFLKEDISNRFDAFVEVNKEEYLVTKDGPSQRIAYVTAIDKTDYNEHFVMFNVCEVY